MELTTIRELFKNREEYLDKKVTVGGWISDGRGLDPQHPRFQDVWIHRDE